MRRPSNKSVFFKSLYTDHLSIWAVSIYHGKVWNIWWFKYIHYSSDLNEPPFLRKTGSIPSGPALEIFGILLRTSFHYSRSNIHFSEDSMSHSEYSSVKSILEMTHWGVENTNSCCSERILVSCNTWLVTSPFLSKWINVRTSYGNFLAYL